MEVVKRYKHVCLRCGYEWMTALKTPIRCANCRSPYWNIVRKNKRSKKV